MQGIEQLRRTLIVAAIVVAAGAVWYFQSHKNDVRDLQPQLAGAKSGSERDKFYGALKLATTDWQADRYREAALRLSQAFPAFESFLNDQGFKEQAPGRTYQQEFDTAAATFRQETMQAYPALLAKVKQGDVAYDDVDTARRLLPPAVGSELSAAWQRDRREITEARVRNAPGWLLVTVTATEADGAGYSTAVQAALRKKWSGNAGLKLVVDQPLRADDVAGRYLLITINEVMVRYEFGAGQQHGSGDVPERLQVSVQPGPSTAGISTSWDKLAPFEVKAEAPEKLRFRFKNAQQQADFDGVAKEQRQRLSEELARSLDQMVPVLTVSPRK